MVRFRHKYYWETACIINTFILPKLTFYTRSYIPPDWFYIQLDKAYNLILNQISVKRRYLPVEMSGIGLRNLKDDTRELQLAFNIYALKLIENDSSFSNWIKATTDFENDIPVFSKMNM